MSSSYPLVARGARTVTTRVRVGNVEIGGDEFVVAAGPCAVETRQQLRAAARAVARAGARLLRGGAFKPRTSPYSFQGLGEEGLRLLTAAGKETGLDPSHGTGQRHLVLPLSKASVSAGADGLILEVHPVPERALSDGPQSLRPEDFSELMQELARGVSLEGRRLALPASGGAGRDLRRLRRRIDGLDEALVRLLHERARVAILLGRSKKSAEKAAP